MSCDACKNEDKSTKGYCITYPKYELTESTDSYRQYVLCDDCIIDLDSKLIPPYGFLEVNKILKDDYGIINLQTQ